ncbi:TPA: 4-alpha-glucanotransferase [Mannheimia haemolytica]|uniref:4-alpha-glucanotransferase n=1 Tax=Mannheimia haemolytica TaxID=75985 RepID=A0A249A306_MANHA|nr:4-alpha-glucanotransferase [Mannheimia haemolytica]AWW72103.1 4-alpha-glucanotransferase [Pasteurellaceae bacterium 12565]AGI33390.1 4-alpha-glucanotransferase [Mannheimia haemolytica USDA-ARS-USMARC-183]AGI34643.1 4-alpha-glucanotransferase [Mannheimia haemolytica USDA-ARS-USMARC-185]AGK01694.1 4-alpha-glucanotransferase MalQ [Mannheimia haemolytica M42548]AGQ26496.1 4-alpha-glucanotransferase [Mannheimia haemolytica D153]
MSNKQNTAHYFYSPNIKEYASPSAFEKIERLLNTDNDLQKNNQILPLVKVITQPNAEQQAVEISLNFTNVAKWQIVLENGEVRNGEIKAEQSVLTLPADLPLGYHQLSISTENDEESCSLIVTPPKAFQPKPLEERKKLWGAFLQLYTLRSDNNWGIGDFGDLKQFLANISDYGADFVGLNPIHALFPADPDAASPYSPSFRLWQNIIYIDVSAVEAFQQSEQAQQWFHTKETQQQLAELRAKDFVDYSQVAQLKLKALQFAFEHFSQSSQQQSQTAFDAFIEQAGEPLKIQATFDALHHWISSEFGEKGGWTNWAEEYQSYYSPKVAEFQISQATQIRFYMWLQFVANQQLAECNRFAQSLSMPIGFYRDLAVGVTQSGAETWADKALFVQEASIGAPPDMLAPNGQSWGLSPMHPHILQSRGYQPFIDLVRANMKHCGALRIDHILGFARMWWVANGESAKEGIYVRYPLEDLLSILALESQRHQCLVIAEALGIVPEGILDSLEQKGIFAYNVFYFEKAENAFKPLENYPYQAMTTLSTHDLPTIQGYWKGYDFELGEKFDTYPSKAVLRKLKEERSYDRLNIRNAVEKVIALEPNEVGVTIKFTHQLQRYVAHTHSALFGTQPEDWLNMLEPVNIPGTSTEYPNWRRKLSATTEQIFANKDIQQLLKDINEIRKG